MDRVRITTFIDDVAGALADSDLVIERAGAGSLAELCAVGRPGLLIPYPYAADDHQRHNAQSLARDGAAVCVVQADADEARFTEELIRLAEDYAARGKMAEAARRRGRPEAAAEIARDLLALSAADQVPAAPEHGEGLASGNDVDLSQRCVPTSEVLL